MSRKDVERLLADLTRELLITRQTFEGLDVEAYLEERDEPGFSEAWMQAFEALAETSVTVEDQVLQSCREQAFKQTFALTGDPELAGYVSDDLRLIGAYLMQDSVRNSFVDRLHESYRLGKLPLR
ncbi:hypothetical protein [Paenibacillus sanfengchensis]|uniref:hypothetical protein n=1 Tax=Paenibacillus sanfengchensis TaxID=3119819 RepID=UPI002FE19FA4